MDGNKMSGKTLCVAYHDGKVADLAWYGSEFTKVLGMVRRYGARNLRAVEVRAETPTGNGL